MAKFLFVLTRGLEAPSRATRCMQLAYMAKQEGHDVSVFLLDDAVVYAKKGMSENVVAPTGDEMSTYMEFFMREGVQLHACTPCAKARQLDEKDFIENAKLDTAKTLIAMAAESKVFTF
ncbi:MAG: DsrE family protein [Desulfomonile tiedjei]|uniref:DsrE family protein n=1 Tax=Desulfomonile tiedjei TaxID=2358 RepID=A0A9D6V0V2_9BACT|nr:DsrE family protein [Desulfomonile tiedjei]